MGNKHGFFEQIKAALARSGGFAPRDLLIGGPLAEKKPSLPPRPAFPLVLTLGVNEEGEAVPAATLHADGALEADLGRLASSLQGHKFDIPSWVETPDDADKFQQELNHEAVLLWLVLNAAQQAHKLRNFGERLASLEKLAGMEATVADFERRVAGIESFLPEKAKLEALASRVEELAGKLPSDLRTQIAGFNGDIQSLKEYKQEQGEQEKSEAGELAQIRANIESISSRVSQLETRRRGSRRET